MMIVRHLLPYIESVITVIVAVAAALVLSVVRLFFEFGAFSPEAILFVAAASIVYAAWWVTIRVKGLLNRLWPPKPITYGQFVELFWALDSRLYGGLLRREGVNPCLAKISTDNPHIYLRAQPDGESIFGGTYAGTHGYSPICQEIVVSRNQSNQAIRQGLLIEMRRAADHLRLLHKAGISGADRDASRIKVSAKLLKEYAKQGPTTNGGQSD
jgi:hypothetical protein